MDNSDAGHAPAARLATDGGSPPTIGNGTAPDAPDVEEGSPPVEQAENFAGYDEELDFTPESLSALDDLAEEIDPEMGEEYAPHVGAYLGATFVRAYDGEWLFYESLGWVVSVPAPDGEEELVLKLPIVMADCMEGEDTFVEVHDDFSDALGLDGPRLADEPEE